MNNRIAFWGYKIVTKEWASIFNTAYPENREMQKIKTLEKPA